jgi:di/tricarboxylate transporter
MPVLIMISAAFGISEAMVQSGAADVVARALMGLAGKSVVSSSISCIMFMLVLPYT